MIENLALALIGGLAGLGAYTLLEPLFRLWMAKRHTALIESRNMLDSVSFNTSDFGVVDGYRVRAVHGFSAYGVYSTGHTLAIYPEKLETQYLDSMPIRIWRRRKHQLLYFVDATLVEASLRELPELVAERVAPLLTKRKGNHPWFNRILFAR